MYFRYLLVIDENLYSFHTVIRNINQSQTSSLQRRSGDLNSLLPKYQCDHLHPTLVLDTFQFLSQPNPLLSSGYSYKVSSVIIMNSPFLMLTFNAAKELDEES